MTDRSRECLKQASRLCTIPRCPVGSIGPTTVVLKSLGGQLVAMPNFD
jgi:hypothetical protein